MGAGQKCHWWLAAWGAGWGDLAWSPSPRAPVRDRPPSHWGKPETAQTRVASRFARAARPSSSPRSPSSRATAPKKPGEQPLTLMKPEISRNAGARRSTGRRLTLDSLTRGLEAKTDVLVVAGTVLAGTRLLALGAEAVGVGERRDGVSLGPAMGSEKTGEVVAGDARDRRRGWDTHPTFTPSCFWYAFSVCSAAMLPEFVGTCRRARVKGRAAMLRLRFY